MIQKYSLKDFLTKEVELIAAGDCSQKIRIHKIEIPMIQRDYAQGRATFSVEKKRGNPEINPTGEKFINELIITLASKSVDSEMELDFVYGSISQLDGVNYFYPLDGQQRLTTLYLLYWFIGGAELELKEKENLREILSNFFYSTRTSSNTFCQQLVSELSKNNLDFLLRNNEDGIVSQIENLSWFHASYNLDPTVAAMLNMLDRIQALYINHNCTDIFNNLDKLRFYILPLTNFDLTEDLYVKMNARGKQLSNFENFKADFQHWLRDNAKSFGFEDKEHAGRKMPYDMAFINKMDNEWAQCLWNTKKTDEDKNYDAVFLKFFYRFWCNEYVIQNKSVNNKELEKSIDFSYFTSEPEYFGFANFGKNIYSRTFIEDLEFVLDRLSENYDDILQKAQPCWNAEFKFLTADSYKLIPRAAWGAVVLYLKNLRKKNIAYNSTAFENWMHVAWNIIENADIDHGYVYIGVLHLLNELSNYSEDIYLHLADPNVNISSTQSKDSVAEERYKARLICVDSSWLPVLRKADSHSFFKGSISFLFPNDDASTIKISDFERNFKLANIFFDNNGIATKYRENGHLFLRALISRYQNLGDIKYHITDTYDTESSLKSMLMSDAVARASIRKWFTEGEENAVKLRLEEEITKPSPIPKKDSDFECKIHESLYRETDLINWMQEKGAIRFRDGYIARPGSSRDWIYVYGYRNEIICGLINKGWECNNRCRLGDREINYFWSPSVGEIMLSKTIDFHDSCLRLFCYIEGKSGILKILAEDVEVIEEFNYHNEVPDSSMLQSFVNKVDDWRPNVFREAKTEN